MTWFEYLPKIELHIHLEGAVPYKAMWELIQKYGGDHSIPDIGALKKRFEFRDFAHFIKTWSWKNQYLREYEDFTFISELVARDLINQNIRYVEMFYSPSLFLHRHLEIQNLTEAIRTGLSRVPEIEVSLIADLVRDYGPDKESRTLEKLKETKEFGVIGIGIGGSEQEFPPEPFESIFERARKMEFRTTAHAGEAGDAKNIWAAVNTLKADRIGHCTRAFEDRRLLNILAQKRIPLEMCPISNVRTGVVENIKNHPIKDYYDEGLLVTVNTDDPKMFNTNLAYEYQALVKECGFSQSDICQLILNSIEASWLSNSRKKALIDVYLSDESWIK